MAPTIHATRATPSIETDSLVCRFGAVHALDGLSVEVRAGSVTALVGPNGAGKTTLLRVLATLRRPDSGVARVAGADVVDEADRVRRLIGYVGHRSLLYLDLTALENLKIHGQLHGLDLESGALREALARVGLDRRRHDRVRGFSRGTVQRLAIARAVLHEPPVLLLDEPHTGLDPRAADTLDDTLAALARRGRTVLLATHDLERASRLADCLAVIDRGRIAWTSPAGGIGPVELRERYRELTDPTAAPRTAGPVSDPGPDTHAEVDGDEPSQGENAEVRSDESSGGENADIAGVTDVTVAPVTRRTSFAAAVRVILWKDLAVEVRAREIVPPVLVFALLVVVIFQFSLPPVPTVREAAAAGAFWVALLLGSTLGISRAMAVETESGGMTGLLVSPIDRGALFAGKWLAGYAFALLVGLALVPAFVVLLELHVALSHVAALIGVMVLGLAGWSAAGVLLGGMAVNTRAREVLLPVLLYPLVLPLVIPAVQATAIALSGAPMQDALAPLALMAAYDIAFWVLGFLFLSHVVGE